MDKETQVSTVKVGDGLTIPQSEIKWQSLESQLDAVLDAAEADGKNHLEIHALLQARRRRRAHVKAKEAQPSLSLRAGEKHADLLGKLDEFWRVPITPEDTNAEPGAIDQLLLTIQDSLDAGDFEDAVFAMARACRKAWAWNQAHLGPIEGVERRKAASEKARKDRQLP